MDNIIPASDVSQDSSKDPSLRIVYKTLHLLPPLYNLPNWDLFRSSAEQGNPPNDCNRLLKLSEIKRLDQLSSLKHLTSFGRPLWYALYSAIVKNGFQEERDRGNWKETLLIDLASKKLTCNHEVNQLLENQTDITFKCFALALFGCRAVINLNPASMITSRLVADFMAICLYINYDRSKMFVTYKSEPILAEASANLCRKNHNLFRTAVDAMTDCFTEGHVDQGDQDELAARLIILKAIDKNQGLTRKHLQPISVRNFLTLLLGTKVVESILKEKVILN